MSDNQHTTPTKRDVEIDLSEELVQGSYANLVVISHSPTEFVLDFASMLPGMNKPKVNNRIIVTPEHAKRLLLSLNDNIVRYESNHGAIEMQQPHKKQQDLMESLRSSSKIGEA
ncbi:MAG: DUF3467 domain-containing protein [Rikenellaceae bacterium]